MQIIIDISKELKQKIDEGFTNQVVMNKLWDATKNGIPLEDIKAELQKLADDEWSQNIGNYARGMEDAIEIIDNHIRGKERQ